MLYKEIWWTWTLDTDGNKGATFYDSRNRKNGLIPPDIYHWTKLNGRRVEKGSPSFISRLSLCKHWPSRTFALPTCTSSARYPSSRDGIVEVPLDPRKFGISILQIVVVSICIITGHKISNNNNGFMNEVPFHTTIGFLISQSTYKPCYSLVTIIKFKCTTVPVICANIWTADVWIRIIHLLANIVLGRELRRRGRVGGNELSAVLLSPLGRPAAPATDHTPDHIIFVSCSGCSHITSVLIK